MFDEEWFYWDINSIPLSNNKLFFRLYQINNNYDNYKLVYLPTFNLINE